jgi:hypothetical protein
MNNFDLPPSFFFAHDRGRSPPRLYKAHAEGKQGETPQDLETPVSP